MANSAITSLSDHSGVVTCVAPTGGVTLKKPIKIGSALIIPLETAAAGASFQGLIANARGAKVLNGATKVSGTAWTTGLALYFDSTNGFTTVATGNSGGYIAAAAAASADTTGEVLALGT